MPDIPLNFGTGSHKGEEPEEGGPIFTNAYAEFTGGEAKAGIIYRPTEGRKLFTTISETGPCRALYVHNGKLYGVIGRNVAVVRQDGSSAILGGLATDGHVTFSANRKPDGGEITVTGGGASSVIFDDVMTAIADPDLPPAIDNDFVDGYTIYTIQDGRMFASSVDDSGVISALDFASAEGDPDNNVRGIARGREFIILGEKSFQVFATDGGDQFPLAAIPGTFRSIGCGAAASAVIVKGAPGNPLVWLDNHKIVRAAATYEGERISTHAVERIIAADPEWASISATHYVRNGHVFYVMSGSNFTLVFDFSTGKWHNRESYGQSRWLGKTVVEFAGKHIVGDAVNGSLYELDPDTHTDAGAHQLMKIRPPVISPFPARMRINGIQLDGVQGRGLNTTDEHNADPELLIRLSKDGGNTFGQDRKVSLGEIGQFDERVIERRFGVCPAKGAQFEFIISAAVCRGFIGGGTVSIDRLAK